MLSSLLPWKISVQRVFILRLNSSRSFLSPLSVSDPLWSASCSFSNCRTRLSTALSLLALVAAILFSMRSPRLPSQFLFIQIKTITRMEGSMSQSMSISGGWVRSGFSRQQRSSLQRSYRKPIFERGSSMSSLSRNKTMGSIGGGQMHIKELVKDDFCGCEHNLDPCPIITSFVKKGSEREMRREYEEFDAVVTGGSKASIKRNYFHALPGYYPELYHAHLVNLLAAMKPALNAAEFLTLSWIHYHAKLEHISYFLFSDLQRANWPKKRFLEAFQLGLIRHEITHTHLLQEGRAQGVDLTRFIDDFYDTYGANVVPLPQYARLLKLLLSRGVKVLVNLLILLLTRKRQLIFETLFCYHQPSAFREEVRQLSWQLFFEQLKEQ